MSIRNDWREIGWPICWQLGTEEWETTEEGNQNKLKRNNSVPETSGSELLWPAVWTMTCSAKTPATLDFWNPKKIIILSAANGRHQPQFRQVNLPDPGNKVLFCQCWKFPCLPNITSTATALHLISHSKPSHWDKSNSSSVMWRNPTWI